MTAHVNFALDSERSLPIADHDSLRAALEEANLPTLLMVYVQLTHDEELLDSFAPFITSPFSLEQKTPPPEMQAQLKAKLFALLTQSPPPASPPLSRELMRHMMDVSVAEPVDEEFVPLLLEQMGFELPAPRLANPERPRPPAGFKVLIIGAGLTGIVAAIKLAEAGYDHVIVEKNPDVGGTWFENRYPGVGVDTPSHFYSFSFEINPEWSHYYPKGREMQEYFLRVADKNKIRDRTIFNTKVVSCIWDEVRGVWNVTTRSGDGVEQVIEANAVINAHGPLNRWQLPKIPGLADFKGPAMHTAAWDQSVDLRGKKVVMVGTGASGIQLASAVAPLAQHLTIFQRSRHWVIRNPEVTKAVTEGEKFALRRIPHYKEWFRFRVYWFTADGLFANVLRDPEWPNQEISVSAHNEMMRQWASGYMHSKLGDRQDLIDKLAPDHPIFSKRVLLDDGWYDTLLRDNVSLENRRIDRIEADAVVLEDGTRVEADVLALATGFNVAKMLGSLTVVGRSGANLGEIWGEEDPRSYLGITVPGFPNFFLTVGPNSAPNHAAGQNLLSEAQIHYIIECLDAVVASKAKSIEVKTDAFKKWNDQIDQRMRQMIWTSPKANSYYNNSKGRNFMSWPYRLVDYWNITRRPDLDSYHIEK